MLSIFFRFLFFFSFFILSTEASTLSWSSPVTIFSSESYSCSLPKLTADPTPEQATAIWVASGSNTIIYSSQSTGGVWSTPVAISASAETQDSLELAVDSSGTHLAVWNVKSEGLEVLESSFNSGSGWSSPGIIQQLGEVDLSSVINLVSSEGGAFLVSWQNLSETGDSNLLGQLSTPYFIPSGELISLEWTLPGGIAIFGTGNSLYQGTIDPIGSSGPLANQITFPRSIVNGSLNLDINSDFSHAVFIFQDALTYFLISAINDGNTVSYTTLSTDYSPVVAAEVLMSPVDSLPVGVWQLMNGEIKAAHFDGHQWVHHIVLSTNGASPTIGYNAANNHAVILWADFTAGGNSNTIQSIEFDRHNWTTPTPISSGGFSVDSPQIKINSDGQGFAIWTRTPSSEDQPILEGSFAGY